MKFTYLIALIFIFITLSGCNSVENTLSVATKELLVTQSPIINTKSFTPSISMTPKPTNNTSTFLTKTATMTLQSNVNTEQIVESTQTPSQTPEIIDWSSIPTCKNGTPDKNIVNIEGVLTYYDANQNYFYAISGFPPTTEVIDIPGDIFTNLIGFSPDTKLLAYTPISPTIGLVSDDGKTIVNIIDKQELLSTLPNNAHLCGWHDYHQWINNKLIALTICYRVDQNSRSDSIFTIIDPFNGTIQTNMINQIPDRKDNSYALFSPDLSRVAYVDNSSNLVLWNNNNNDNIEINQPNFDSNIFFGNYITDPRALWSYDSTKLAISASEVYPVNSSTRGVYILDREGGDSQRITNFTNKYDTFQAYDFQWSKNDRFLAFGVSHSVHESYGQSIYIYDTVSDKFVYHCDLNQTDEIKIRWSPDNQAIGYSNTYASPLIIIDLKTGDKYQLTDRAIIGDWTNNTNWVSK
jgi:hypothetical protein